MRGSFIYSGDFTTVPVMGMMVLWTAGICIAKNHIMIAALMECIVVIFVT